MRAHVPSTTISVVANGRSSLLLVVPEVKAVVDHR